MSTTSWRSLSGTISRILSSTCWKMRSVVSIRVPAGRTDMKLDLASIDRRIEVPTDEDQQGGSKGKDQDGDDRHDQPTCKQQRQQPDIADTHRLETMLEPGMKAGEPIFRSAMALALEQQPMVIGVRVLERP